MSWRLSPRVMMTPGGLKAVELLMMNYFGASWITQKNTVSVGEGYGIYGPWRPGQLFHSIDHEISTKPYRVLNSHDVWGRHLFRSFSPSSHIWNILGQFPAGALWFCSILTYLSLIPISINWCWGPSQFGRDCWCLWGFQCLLTEDFRTRWLRSGTWCQSGRWYLTFHGWMGLDGVGSSWTDIFAGKKTRRSLSDETLVNLIYSPENLWTSPENQWLEDVFPIENRVTLGDMLVFGGVEDIWWNLVIVRRYVLNA